MCTQACTHTHIHTCVHTHVTLSSTKFPEIHQQKFATFTTSFFFLYHIRKLNFSLLIFLGGT